MKKSLFSFKKSFYVLLIIVIIGSIPIITNITKEEINIEKGIAKVKEINTDMMAVNLQKTKNGCTDKDNNCYDKTTEVPESGYKLNTTNSYCTNGNTENKDTSIPMEYKNGTVTIGVTKEGTRCYLYFDIVTGKTFKQIIADNYIAVKTRANGTFNTIVSSSSTGVIYKSADSSQYDDFGEVYYFAGNPQDNWVKFGALKSGSTPIWWRIIRVNGDGSIRMIYAGTGNTAPQTTGTGTQISTSKFNDSSGDNAYVGYMYGATSASTWAQTHANNNPSAIKKALDDWYTNTSNLETLSTKLSDSVGFCGDRSSSTSSSGPAAQSGGTGTTVTYYGAYVRVANKGNPTFKCTYASNDLYTTKADQIKKGNQKLTYPIGLITADEVAFAGGVYNTNNKQFYLYTNQYYWTMSPSNFSSGGYARVFYVDFDGWLNNNDYSVTNTNGVRPVINLKADVTFAEGGAGTKDNPYIPT